MIYIILAGAFMVATGIVLANYELVKQRRDRSERLRNRARRCVRREWYTQWRQGARRRALDTTWNVYLSMKRDLLKSRESRVCSIGWTQAQITGCMYF